MKPFKMIFFLLFVLLFMLVLPISAATVSFDGEYEGLTIDASDNNLFEQFDSLIPGEQATTTILVTNNSDKEVSIHLRADPTSVEDETFLDYVDVKVKTDRLTESITLTDPILLGIFQSNDVVKLDVTVTIDLDLPNDYQNYQAQIPWTFIVQELGSVPRELPITVDDDTPGNVKTGVAATYQGYLLIVVITGVGYMIFCKFKKINAV